MAKREDYFDGALIIVESRIRECSSYLELCKAHNDDAGTLRFGHIAIWLQSIKEDLIRSMPLQDRMRVSMRKPSA